MSLYLQVQSVHIMHIGREGEYYSQPYMHSIADIDYYDYNVPYSLDQTPLSISRRSRIVATPPEVLNEIVATLE